MVIRDDYDTARATFPLQPAEDQQDRMSGLLDSLVDGWKQAECAECTVKINNDEDTQ